MFDKFYKSRKHKSENTVKVKECRNIRKARTYEEDQRDVSRGPYLAEMIRVLNRREHNILCSEPYEQLMNHFKGG